MKQWRKLMIVAAAAVIVVIFVGIFNREGMQNAIQGIVDSVFNGIGAGNFAPKLFG